MLCALYFWRAEAYLIDPAVAVISRPVAISISLAVLAASWLLYDALCRWLERQPLVLGGVLGALFAAEAWGLCHVFSGRGAFMIYGAALGTIMVANVLFVIIPGQRELVRAKQQGREPQAAPGQRGKQRSVHNTYFTLPVLFIMISNHYAMTFGARYNWLVLIAFSLAGACIRAWFVARQQSVQRGGYVPVLPAVLGVLSLAALIVALAPARARGGNQAQRVAVTDERGGIQRIIEQRCVPCHATHPTLLGFAAAPNGLVLENVAQLEAHLPEVQQQLTNRTMPLGNLTAMTEDERALLLDWIGHGARH